MECEFVRLNLKNNPAANAKLDGHQEIVLSYAKKGYAYSGFIPVDFGPSGKMLAVDLVFQKND